MVHIIGSFKDKKGRDFWINKNHSDDSLMRTLVVKNATDFKTATQANKFIETFNSDSIRANEVVLRVSEVMECEEKR
jgi:hypothetical protein